MIITVLPKQISFLGPHFEIFSSEILRSDSGTFSIFLKTMTTRGSLLEIYRFPWKISLAKKGRYNIYFIVMSHFIQYINDHSIFYN